MASSLLCLLAAVAAWGADDARAGRLALLTSVAQAPMATLWIVGPDGAPRKRCELAARRAAWSPDGKLIAAWSGTRDAPGPLLVVDPASGDAPRILVERGSEPGWRPDGKALAFTRDGGGIAVVEAAGSGVRDVPGSERGYAAAYSADGERIAFARASGGAGSVWTVRLDGSAPVRAAFCARPHALAWSPDGMSLAVIEHDPERMATARLSVLRVGADAPDPKATVRADRLAWLPDGLRIAADGPSGPCLIEVATGRVTSPGDKVGAFAGVTDSQELVEMRGTTVRGLRAGSAARTLASAGGVAAKGAVIVDASWSSTATATAIAVNPAVPTVIAPATRDPGETSAASPAPAGVFPVVGQAEWTDTFGAPRHGERRHQGQDLMAPKMRPVVACFAGIVMLRRSTGVGGHNWLVLVGDNGWTATYLHLNNDTPGTDDGMGTEKHAFAQGLATGARVVAGQLLGWVGDSGNAEQTAPHLHFELAETGTGISVNPAAFLRASERLEAPRPTP